MGKRVDLLQGSIAGALTKLALPLMGTSFIQMAYNLTDMIWIGRLGAGAVASVGVVGNYTWLATGLVTLARVGGQVRVAQKIGAKETEHAGRYAQTSLQMGILLSALMGAVMLIFAQPLIAFFGMTGAQVIADAEIYMRIVGLGLVFNCFVIVLSALITTTGNSHTPFLATTVGLVVNIVVDPMLIFGWFGLPKLGVAGAAIATVLAQIVVAALLIGYMIRDKHLFCHVHLLQRPHPEIIKDILKLSAPAALQNLMFPFIALVLSRLVAGFGDNAVAVQRVGVQIESISWMTADGFAMAVGSFVGQNWGAGNIRRAKRGYYTSIAIVAVWGLLCTGILLFAAKPLFRIFITQEDILPMGINYLVILSVSQLPMCLEIITTGAFNGFGRTVTPAVINGVFTVARIPMALILSATALGLNGIWWSISLSSIFKGTILVIVFFLFCRSLRKQYPDCPGQSLSAG